MALEDMLKTLESEGKKEQQTIIADAKERAAAILSKAKDEAKQIKQDEIDKALFNLAGEKAKMVNEARLHVKKEVVLAKEEGVTEIYSQVSEKLSKLRKSSKYPEILEKMIIDAIKHLEGEMKVQVNDEDVDLAKKILSKNSISADVSGGLETFGGLVVTTDEGKIVIHNNLESRMEKAKQYIKADIMKMVYEEQ